MSIAKATPTMYVGAHECANCSHSGINDEHETDAICESCDWRGLWPEDGACPECKRSIAAICPKCDGGPYVCVADGHVELPPELAHCVTVHEEMVNLLTRIVQAEFDSGCSGGWPAEAEVRAVIAAAGAGSPT